LEVVRDNSVRTRNNRLSAVHSLFAYAALCHPEHAGTIQRVLAIPIKLSDRKLVTYLEDDEVDALPGACDLGTWTGRRDQALPGLAVGAGPRISELAALGCPDVILGRGANLHVTGKGRKERHVPLGQGIVRVLRARLRETGGDAAGPLFPATTGGHMSRDAIERRVTLHVKQAAASCPSLQRKPVTTHSLRHTCAMRLQRRGVASDATFREKREDTRPALQRRQPSRRAGRVRQQSGDGLRCHHPVVSTQTMLQPLLLHPATRMMRQMQRKAQRRGGMPLPPARQAQVFGRVGKPLPTSFQSGTDITVIALWLGHEQIATAQIYLHADMQQKERAIARVSPPGTAPGRCR
jgi:integrase